MDVLKRINELRKKRSWTEYQLAEKSGLPQSTISSWYRKNMLPSLGSLEKICLAFDITMANFFADNENEIYLSEQDKLMLSLWNNLTANQKKQLILFLQTL